MSKEESSGAPKGAETGNGCCSRPGENKELAALEQFTRYEIQGDHKAENTETSDSFSTVAQRVTILPL